MTQRKKFGKVQNLIVRFSKGDFDHKTKQAAKSSDIIDAFLENLAMLGEELNETTVSKEYFVNIFNSVPDVILILDQKGKVLTYNHSLESLIDLRKKYKPDTLVFDDVYSGLDNKNAFSVLKRKINEQGLSREIKVKLRDESNSIYQCSFTVMRSGTAGKKYIALIKDITQLENYQARLIDSELKYRQVFNNSSDGIFLLTRNGAVHEINSALRTMLRIKSETTDKINLKDFLIPESASVRSLLKTITQKNHIANIEVKVRANDGTFHDCLFSCVPNYENNMITGYLGMIKNISQYKQYNSLLMRSVSELQDRERRRIASDLHDSLGQQLVGIKFMVGSLISLNSDQRQTEYLKQINTSIYNTIDELRTICFDLMPGSLENFGLINTLEELISKLKKMNRSITIDFTTQPDFPRMKKELEVNMYRIVQELLNNSYKYSGCNHVTLSCLIVNRKNLHIRYNDNGKGIKEEQIKKSRGNGIKNIISRANSFAGTVKIKSKPGQGMQVDVRIPGPLY